MKKRNTCEIMYSSYHKQVSISLNLMKCLVRVYEYGMKKESLSASQTRRRREYTEAVGAKNYDLSPKKRKGKKNPLDNTSTCHKRISNKVIFIT